MTANTRIIADERKDVLRVPVQAIRFSPFGLAGAQDKSSSDNTSKHKKEGSRVWVLRDGKPVAVQVTTGLSDNSNVEITGDSLKEGDKVIVNAIAANNSKSSNRARLRF